jgi:3-deoxy-D-manno-octulosonic-acid transferase
VDPSFRRALAGYNLLLTLAAVASFPLWLPWMLWARKRRCNFLPRLGFGLPAAAAFPPPVLWFHAVSVGETLAAVPLVRAVRKEWPKATIVLSTVTVTGRETGRKALEGVIDRHVYFPFDVPFVCRRFLDRLRPAAVVILETEIWPNFLAELRRRAVPALLVNGRLSGRSARGYGRFRPLFGGALSTLDALCAQSEEDGERYRSLLPPAARGRVSVTGNMKFDTALPDLSRHPLAAFMERHGRDGIRWIVAGSTHAGEERAVLDGYRSAREGDPKVRLLVAPRHPERFDEVDREIRRAGLALERRSRMAPSPVDGPAPCPDVILLDTMGELGAAYGAASLAFVGGSLVPVGGHNVIEPALFGVPVVTGSHLENFREVESLFLGAEAIVEVRDGEELKAVLAGWSRDPSALDAAGARGKALLDLYRGATDRNLATLRALLGPREAGE